jgi:hypothetical protein
MEGAQFPCTGDCRAKQSKITLRKINAQTSLLSRKDYPCTYSSNPNRFISSASNCQKQDCRCFLHVHTTSICQVLNTPFLSPLSTEHERYCCDLNRSSIIADSHLGLGGEKTGLEGRWDRSLVLNQRQEGTLRPVSCKGNHHSAFCPLWHMLHAEPDYIRHNPLCSQNKIKKEGLLGE